MPRRGLLRSKTQADSRLFESNYQNKLRIIGRHLDLHEFKHATVLEVNGGLLARATDNEFLTPTLLEFPDESFEELYREAIAKRGQRGQKHMESKLIPTGYEDLFRAIGAVLDERFAKSILITECSAWLRITGFELESSLHRSAMAPFDLQVGPDDAASVVDQYFRLRSKS